MVKDPILLRTGLPRLYWSAFYHSFGLIPIAIHVSSWRKHCKVSVYVKKKYLDFFRKSHFESLFSTLTYLRLSQMTLDSPQIESDDTWLTSDWVRWQLTHLRLSQMTLDSPQIESDDTWLNSDWTRWQLTHLRLSQITLDSPQIESDDTWLTSDWVR